MHGHLPQLCLNIMWERHTRAVLLRWQITNGLFSFLLYLFYFFYTGHVLFYKETEILLPNLLNIHDNLPIPQNVHSLTL